MAGTEIITPSGRKAIKKMAEVSQCVRALDLMPTPEEFALMLIGDVRYIAQKLNNVYSRVNGLMDRYSSIPSEFLLEGFDAVIDRLNNISDFAKSVVADTADVLSNTVMTAKGLTDSIGYATSTTTSAILQVGGGLAYGAVAMGKDLKLAMTGENKRVVVEDITHDVMRDVIDGKIAVGEMDAEIERRIQKLEERNVITNGTEFAEDIRNGIENAATKSTESIDSFFGNISSGMDDALNWIDGRQNAANDYIDEKMGGAIEEVKKAKKKVEDLIERVRKTFKDLMDDFDEAFGTVTGKGVIEDGLLMMSENAAASEFDSPVVDAIAQTTKEVANFVSNFSIGKTVSAFGGLVVGAGVATLTMDLLPNINVDKMLKDIIGGVDNIKVDKILNFKNNRNDDGSFDLFDVPDFPWRLTKDDLEKYNADGYNKFLEQFGEENDNARSELFKSMANASNPNELSPNGGENKYKSALKALRKVRRDAIKARQIEKYKSFLSTELEFLKTEFVNVRDKIKNDWDSMMKQYKTAIDEITKFFTEEGYGGNDAIDICCDQINEDAEQIVELCKSITVELTNTVAKVPTPYSIGTCVDMPVHKILTFFEEAKIILTFLKNLIMLGIDIIKQFLALAKIIANNIQSLADLLKKLKELFGVDMILDMIDFIISLFKSKMVEGKILLENSLSPIYYNETEDYEMKVEAIEAMLEDEKDGGYVDMFRYTDDINAKKKYRNKIFGGYTKDDEEIEDVLEELEAKGEREIVAYRSPILNAAGDDFAGWIYYHAYAYDNMKKSWSKGKKRRRNKLIKKASKKNKMRGGKLVGGVAQLKQYHKFGYYKNKEYIKNSVTGYEAYYWYTKWTNDPTDCEIDMLNEGKDVVVPIQTTANGSLVELGDGRRVFVEGKIVQSGDFVNVDGVRYRVK